MPIRIEGLSQLSEMLTNIAPTAARRYMRKALGAGADIVQKEAEARAPSYVGYLEESIVQKGNFESDSDAGTTTLSVAIGPTKQAFWGMFQEFGTQDVEGEDRKKKHFHHTAQPAQRWLTNSWLSTRDEVQSEIATQLTGLLMDLEHKV